jgi:hypothetical protein
MTSYQDVRFPPRAELPPGVTIPRLPIVGRTWYERGFAYWVRRAWSVLVLCVAVAVYATFIGAAMLAAGRPGSPGFLAVLVGESVFSLVTGVFAFRHLWQLGISGRATGSNSRGGGAGAGAGLALAQLGVLGGFLLAWSVLLSAGFLLAAMAIWLVPVPPAERHARKFLAYELENQPYHGHSPGNRGRHHRMTSQFAISIERPVGEGWVRLPTRKPKRPGLFTTTRGKDKNLAQWAAITALELLGPETDNEPVRAYAEQLAGLAVAARVRDIYLAYVRMLGSAEVPAANVEVSLFRTSRAYPVLTLDTLEELYAKRDPETTSLEVGRVELPAGPAVRLHRQWQGGDDPSDTVVSITYLCRPPDIKPAVVYTMSWLIDDDDPELARYADKLATTLQITTQEPDR